MIRYLIRDTRTGLYAAFTGAGILWASKNAADCFEFMSTALFAAYAHGLELFEVELSQGETPCPSN